MGQKQVIAYCIHEREFDEVRKHIKNADWTRAYAVGLIEEDAIALLEAQGLVVEVVGEAGQPPTAGGAPRARFRSAAAGASGDLGGTPLSASLHPTKDNFFVIRFKGPVLLDEWRQKIEALGIRLIELRSATEYTARMSLTQLAQVRTLPCVDEVHLLSPAETGGAAFTTVADVVSFGVPPAPTIVPFDIVVHSPDDLDEVESWLTANHVPILAKGRRKVRVQLAVGSPQAREIQALPVVLDVQEFVPPELSNERARRLLDSTAPRGPF